MVEAFITDDQPVISVDTKEEAAHRQLRQWRRRMATHGRARALPSFVDRAPRRSRQGHPYGIYDEGWVNVGDTANTAEFAVESIRRWWNEMGRAGFPDAQWILIITDAGGSKGYRLRACKVQLARLAAETGVSITAPLPRGTSHTLDNQPTGR
jgi:hypothetical protein